MSDWEHGLCGCFDDCGTCLLAWLVPCYLIGKDAEAVGENCFLWGCVYLFFPFCVACCVRTKVRSSRNIQGSTIGDFCCSVFCHFCITAQMHQEVLAMGGSSMAIERE